MRTRNIQFSKDKAGSSGSMGKKNPMEEGISNVVKLKSENVEERIAAAKELGKLKGKRVVDHLVEAMQDEEPEVREAVVRSIVSVGDKSVVPAMIEALDDTTGVVIGAIVALGKFGDESALPALRELYLDPILEVQTLAISAVASIDKESGTSRFTIECVDRAMTMAGLAGDKAANSAYAEGIIESGSLRIKREESEKDPLLEDADPSPYERLLKKSDLIGYDLDGYMDEKMKHKWEDSIIELATEILLKVDAEEVQLDRGNILGPLDQAKDATDALVGIGPRGVSVLIEVLSARAGDMESPIEDILMPNLFAVIIGEALAKGCEIEHMDSLYALAEEKPELKEIISTITRERE